MSQQWKQSDYPAVVPTGAAGRPDAGGDVFDLRIAAAKREWETTVDALSQIVCLLDQHGNVVRVNRAIETWGVGSVDDVRGRPFHDLLHPNCADPQCYLKAWWPPAQARLNRGEAESRQVDDTQLRRRVSINLRPVTVNLPVPGGYRVVALIEDITEISRVETMLRRGFDQLERQVAARTRELAETNGRLRRQIDERLAAEQALRQHADEVHDLYNNAPCGYHSLDADGVFVRINDTELQWLGVPRNDVIGRRSFADFLAPASREHYHAGFAALKQNGFCVNQEYELVRADGTRFPVVLNATVVRDAAGEFLMSRATVFDIAPRKRAEDALRRSEAELRTLSTELMTAQELERKRIAGELHDSVGQMLSALSFEFEDATLAEIVPGEFAAQFGTKIRAIADEVRRISMNLRPSMLDDLGVLPTVTWFCRELKRVYSGIEIETVLDVSEQDIPFRLRTVIFRVLQEALNNAARHSGARRIRVVLRRLESAVELRIADDGAGFETAQMVLKPGDRRGLGLNTMRERAETSGARFRLESMPGHGTMVWAIWPDRS